MKKLNIIYEDKELLVVEKESHLLTIATEKRESRTLYNEASAYVKKQYPKNKWILVSKLHFFKISHNRFSCDRNWRFCIQWLSQSFIYYILKEYY